MCKQFYFFRTFVRCLPMLIVLFVISFLNGCAVRAIPAPVDNYQVTLSNKPEVHKVRRGDTFYTIAWRYELDPDKLAKINQLKEPFPIYVGQVIKLQEPKSKPYIAKKQVSQPLKLANAKRVEQPSRKTKSVAQKRKPPRKKQVASSKKTVNAKQRFIWPVKNASKISSQRKGVDIYGQIGDSISSVGDGQVVYSGSGLKHYGNLIIVKHHNGILSAYAQNEKRLVKEGEAVKQGQVIAKMGQIGRHAKLYFEMRRQGTPIDPLKFLPKRH